MLQMPLQSCKTSFITETSLKKKKKKNYIILQNEWKNQKKKEVVQTTKDVLFVLLGLIIRCHQSSCFNIFHISFHIYFISIKTETQNIKNK